MGRGQNIRYPILIAEWGLALYLWYLAVRSSAKSSFQ